MLFTFQLNFQTEVEKGEISADTKNNQSTMNTEHMDVLGFFTSSILAS